MLLLELPILAEQIKEKENFEHSLRELKQAGREGEDRTVQRKMNE